MSYSVILTDNFIKEAKPLVKKYASLKKELDELFTELEQNPTLGTPLGNDIYKIRLAIASKNKGKSGGARIMTFVKIIDTTIFLTTIYDKSDYDTIADEALEQLFKLIP